MAQAGAQRIDEESATETASARRPEATVRVQNVEIAIWRNHGEKGDFYSASSPTLRYKDGPTGEWKDGSSYGMTDLLCLTEAAREASAKIRELSKGRGQNR